MAVSEKDSYYFVDYPYIWDRRKNLQGLELKLMSLSSSPFTVQEKDYVSTVVSKNKTNLILFSIVFRFNNYTHCL